MTYLKSALVAVSALALTGCYSFGEQNYTDRADTDCEALVDPAAMSECRTNNTLSRAERRAERRNKSSGS